MKQAKAKRSRFWDYLAWVAFAIVFVYLLLKLPDYSEEQEQRLARINP